MSVPAEAPSPSFLRDRATLTVGGAYLLLGAVTGSMGPVSDQLRGELDLTATVTGFYGSAFGWALLAATLVGGPLRRRLGERRLFAAGIVVILGAVALMCVARVVEPSLAGAVGVGVGATAVVLSGPTLVARRHRDEGRRSDAFTLVNALSTVGSVTAPLVLAATLGLGLGWRVPWLMIAVAIVAGIAVLARTRTAPVAEPDVGGAADASTEGAAERGPFALLAALPVVRRRWVVLVLGIGVEFTALLWGSTVIQRLGGSSASVGALGVGLFGVGMLVGRAIGPRVVRGRDHAAVLRVLFVGVAVAALVLRFAPGAPARVAAMAGIGLGLSLVYPFGFLRLYTPAISDSEVSTLGGFAAGTAIALAPPLLGVVADGFGIDLAILLAPAMALVALALLANEPQPAAPGAPPPETPLPETSLPEKPGMPPS